MCTYIGRIYAREIGTTQPIDRRSVSVNVKSAKARGGCRATGLWKSVSETRARERVAAIGKELAAGEKRSGSVSTHDVAYCNEATVH